MIGMIILLVISVIILSLILYYTKKEHGDNGVIWFTITVTCAALCAMVTLVEWNEPTPLDVYRGKTTLEITYRDSVAVDSVVVYKGK